MPAISDSELSNWFTYHAPTGEEQLQGYREIRLAGFRLARAIRDHAPVSADTTAAIRKVREATMTANAAIACASGDAIPPIDQLDDPNIDPADVDPSGEAPPLTPLEE